MRGVFPFAAHSPPLPGALASALAPIPTPIGTLSTQSDWVVHESRARAARERMERWEAAFVREQGESSTAKLRGSSATYSAFGEGPHARGNERSRALP